MILAVVEGGDIAQAELFEDFVAHLHLFDEPVERGIGAMRFGDDRGDHVGEISVAGQLDFFRIDHEQFDFIGAAHSSGST